jgi:hypothetical protein
MVLSNVIVAEKNRLSQPGVWTWLLAVTPAGSGTTYRFTNNTEALSYQGHTYDPMPFRIDPIETTTDGQLQALQITVTDIGMSLQSVLRANNGLRNASVTISEVNTTLLGEDYSEDSLTFQVSHCQNRYCDIIFYCGVPGSLKHRVPEDEYWALQCRHDFRIPGGGYSSRCGYVGKVVAGVSLPAGNPVIVEVSGHPFVTGDSVRLYGVAGITPSLDADWTVTGTDASHFTLDGTNGSSYGGSYSGGGKAGFARCVRTLNTCRLYHDGQGSPYGGIAASRSDSVRLAV